MSQTNRGGTLGNARESRRLRRPALLLLAAAAVTAMAGTAVALAPNASAGETYTIKTASIPSPPGSGQEPGGGARLANKPFGYYIGRAMVDTKFTSMGSLKNHHWGRAHDTVNMCAWVYDDALNASQGGGDNSCSDATQETMSHRLSFGRDFNFEPHVGNGPTPVTVLDPNCVLHYNYFQGSDFEPGHWANPVGPIGTAIEYRFTTKDGGAYVVRHPTAGWGFVGAGCTTRPGNLNNDND
jgi:hypothetical protein